jgi:hypothetical protein
LHNGPSEEYRKNIVCLSLLSPAAGEKKEPVTVPQTANVSDLRRAV